MSTFEYILALVSILVGLAIADLSVSVHHLLRARARIRWDWIPLGAAVLVLLMILTLWWSFYDLGQVEAWTHYGRFLVLMATLVAIFLLASAALPDRVPDDGLDLTTYYEENRRYFWMLFAVTLLFASAVNVVTNLGAVGLAQHAMGQVPNLVLVAIAVSLAHVRSRTYHAIVVPLLIIGLGWTWSGLRLA